MSVGAEAPDIPIIDVLTGEDTSLKSIIGNGARAFPSLSSRPHHRSQSLNSPAPCVCTQARRP
jgi:hypothetical protein